MKRDDFSWMIGGAQGSGVDTPATIFAKAAATAGLHVYGSREYYSNIKGEHSYFQVRVGRRPLRSQVDTVDMLATFDDETVARHAWAVRKDGAILYDPDVGRNEVGDIATIEPNVLESVGSALEEQGLPHTIEGVVEAARRRGVHAYPIPYADLLKGLAERLGEPSLSSLTRMANVMAVAGSFALLGFPRDTLDAAIRRQFKSSKVAETNIGAVEVAYKHVLERFGGSFGYKLRPAKTDEKRVLVRGTSVVGMGKILSGCRLQTYYPITPASDESEYLEAHDSIDLPDGKGSVLVVQTEDEIAAILMAIGGGLAGVRAATSTSGPGFSLMAEGIGWAGMNEVPVVVTLYQRGGPSTGMPTRHEQGDVRFALHTGHGEFPRIVLASGDLEESFYDVAKAFNYAERYQLPVIHLLDKALANTDQTCPRFDPQLAKIDRGLLTKGPIKGGEAFKRFALTPTGVSPRPAIGTEGGIFWNTGDEHDERGHISEDPTNRVSMMAKRMEKLALAAEEIPPEDRFHFYGPADAPLTIVSWGSTKGAILDAMEALKGDGVEANFLQIRLINPFPTADVAKVLSSAKKVVDVEMNYSGQMAGIIQERTCVPVERRVVKYNGRPMSCEEVYDALKQAASGSAPKRMVLRNGP
jgi:2-oxoglutarate/2-oxoacid ferredoxin oxidoreductase subunit alpha